MSEGATTTRRRWGGNPALAVALLDFTRDGGASRLRPHVQGGPAWRTRGREIDALGMAECMRIAAGGLRRCGVLRMSPVCDCVCWQDGVFRKGIGQSVGVDFVRILNCGQRVSAWLGLRATGLFMSLLRLQAMTRLRLCGMRIKIQVVSAASAPVSTWRHLRSCGPSLR